jgi:hypothetical protein
MAPLKLFYFKLGIMGILDFIHGPAFISEDNLKFNVVDRSTDPSSY